MKKSNVFVFTGGGTGGHVIPNLAVISELKKIAPRAKIAYVGCRDSIEEKLARENGIEFHAVSAGKLRRYFSWQNFIDAGKIPVGIFQAVQVLRKLKPRAVFAKGGFVSVPTAVAAGLLRIPLVIHESDATPGLATKIAGHFAIKICVSFPPEKFNSQIEFTGNPIRQPGSKIRGQKFLKFKNKRPVILVVGGSTGASALNRLVESAAPEILKFANLVWLTGGQPTRNFRNAGLRKFDFLRDEYLDVLAAADLVVSRAGANAIFEIAAAGRPSILVPLPAAGSRGDQILNAEFFAHADAALVSPQSSLTPTSLTEQIAALISDEKKMKKMSVNAKKIAPLDSAARIAKIVHSL